MSPLIDPGVLHHYVDLGDADKWQVMAELMKRSVSIIRETLQRCTRHENFGELKGTLPFFTIDKAIKRAGCLNEWPSIDLQSVIIRLDPIIQIYGE